MRLNDDRVGANREMTKLNKILGTLKLLIFSLTLLCKIYKQLKNMEELLEFLIKWGKKNDFEFILPTDDEKNIDFICVNLKTQKIYADELDINKPLTEVG